nr:MAG TPA: hypothetical protein [Bacteriophage sp.]
MVSIGVPIQSSLLRFFCQKTIFNNIECYTTIFYCYILFEVIPQLKHFYPQVRCNTWI